MLEQDLMDSIEESDKAQMEAFERMAKLYTPNATFREGVTARQYAKYKFFKALILAIVIGEDSPATMSIIGPNGIGKTKALLQFIQNLVFRGQRYFRMSWNTSMDDFDTQGLQMAAAASWDEAKMVLRLIKNLQYQVRPGQKGIFVLDDFNRTLEHLLNVIMQLIDKWELLGEPVENLAAMILLSNPSGGEDDVLALDFTQADRSYTMVLGRDDVPWEFGLAAKHPDIDLSDAFRIVKSLPDATRDVLSARTLDHMIQVLLYGLPGVLAIPVSGPDGFMVRQTLRDFSSDGRPGDDITEKVIADIARSIGAPNPKPEQIPDLYQRTVHFALDSRNNVMIFGEPGVGKTEATKALVKARGFRAPEDCAPGEYATVFATSGPGLTREYFSAPYPTADRTALQYIGAERFMIPEPYVWIDDEANRISPEAKATKKSVQYDRMIGDQELNMVSCISLANPPLTVDGMPLSLGEPFDLAEATRYAASLYVDSKSIDWEKHLRGKYGAQFASYFIEWRREDLDENLRPKITPRCLERMIKLVRAGADPQLAIPAMDGVQIEAPVALLKHRLERGELPRISRIAEDVERYERELAAGEWITTVTDGNSRTFFVPENHLVNDQVAEAFRMADLPQLEEHREVCLRLFPMLGNDERERFIVHGDKVRQPFWASVLVEGEPSARAKAKKAGLGFGDRPQ